MLISTEGLGQEHSNGPELPINGIHLIELESGEWIARPKVKRFSPLSSWDVGNDAATSSAGLLQAGSSWRGCMAVFMSHRLLIKRWTNSTVFLPLCVGKNILAFALAPTLYFVQSASTEMKLIICCNKFGLDHSVLSASTPSVCIYGKALKEAKKAVSIVHPVKYSCQLNLNIII